MGFGEKTLREITRALETAIFFSQFSEKNGFLQNINPKLKILGVFLLMVAVSFSKSIIWLLIFAILSLFLAILSKIPFLFFFKRIFVFIPIFALILVFPAMFNFITHGDTLILITKFHTKPFDMFPNYIAITKQGLGAVLFLTLRIIDSVALSALVVLTTKWTDIVIALRAFFMPWFIILVLLISYRYIFIFLSTAEKFFLAKNSRTLGNENLKSEYNWISSKIAMLIKKSYNLSEGVYLSMESRGYNEYSVLACNSGILIFNIIWIFGLCGLLICNLVF